MCVPVCVEGGRHFCVHLYLPVLLHLYFHRSVAFNYRGFGNTKLSVSAENLGQSHGYMHLIHSP